MLFRSSFCSSTHPPISYSIPLPPSLQSHHNMRSSSGGGRAKGFVPVAVVTGFYGSGKTSLLHRLAAKLVAPSSSPLSIALLLHSLSEGTPSHAPNPTPSFLLFHLPSLYTQIFSFIFLF